MRALGMGAIGKNMAARRLAQGLLAGLTAALLPGLALGCEKTLRWDDDPPFSLQRADGEVVGINVESNRLVLERLGCTVRLVKLPWGRALKELELGRLDILPGAFRRPDREAYAHFTGPFGTPSRNILFMHEDALARYPIGHLLELRGGDFRLGSQTNVSYGEAYQTLMQDEAFAARVHFSASRASLWQMVGHRRIDGVIADELTGRYEINQMGLGAVIRPTAVVVADEAAEVALSKRSNSLAFAARYREALAALEKDGTLARIVDQYVEQPPR